jgi:DNA-binding LacI/PurR family transcriptional regulator
MMNQMKKIPMYRIIVEDLKRKINLQEFDPSQPFPSHIELSEWYKTSAITTRRALSELANEGLLKRIQKKGSFLVPNQKRDEAQHISKRSIEKIYFVYHLETLQLLEGRFYSELLEGLQHACDQHGVMLHMWDMGEAMQLPDEENAGFVLLPTFMLDQNDLSIDVLKKWQEEQRNLVTIHYRFPHLQIPYVIVDNLTGGYLATEHLLSLGHTRIGIILTGNSYYEMNQEFSLRLQGYKLALSQHKIHFDVELVNVVSGHSELESMGYQAFQQLANLSDPPTAIFATSDYKALGVLKAATERNLCVPGDLSIVGYDDLLLGQFTSPTLTTVKQNSYLLGKKAFELLHFDYSRANMRDEIVPELIKRGSTGPIK